MENLRPYTRYRLRLIAVNIVGRSKPSLPTREFKTLQAAPSVPPGNVTVRAVNATALRVSWMVNIVPLISLVVVETFSVRMFHEFEELIERISS